MLGQPAADLGHLGQIAGAVVLPEAAEATQLALQVAGRLAEAVEPEPLPVGVVQFDQPVDQLVGDPATLPVVVEGGRDRVGDHLTLDQFHHVERRADHLLVVAHRQDLRRAHVGRLERPQQSRLAQHVVRRGRQRTARRPAQHDACRERERDVRVAVTDRLSGELVGCLEPVRAQEAEQRVDHQQRLALVGTALLVRTDEVVRSERDRHLTRQPTGSACERMHAGPRTTFGPANGRAEHSLL